jgi:tetratricopeptide (TPR) repeat protein
VCSSDLLDLALALGHRALEADCQKSLGNIALLRGDLDGARARFTAAVATQRAIGQLRGAALALVDLGRIASYAGDLGTAELRFTEGLTAAREAGAASVEAQALRWLGTLPLEAGRPADGEALLVEAVVLERKTGLPRRIAESLAWLGRCWSELGRHEEALAAWDEALALLGQGEARLVEALYRTGRAEARRRAGRLAEARDDALAALAVIEGAASHGERIRALCLLGRIAADVGDPQEAGRRLDAAAAGLAAQGLGPGSMPGRDVDALARRLGRPGLDPR